ncbi:MAG: secretion system protein E [Thermoplasmata archaeon HGW-Thermoplasmata-1]|nr:MAG: secretion system protein E [Thermoplasmata archaeon HGW-Thermoplasmata-1]
MGLKEQLKKLKEDGELVGADAKAAADEIPVAKAAAEKEVATAKEAPEPVKKGTGRSKKENAAPAGKKKKTAPVKPKTTMKTAGDKKKAAAAKTGDLAKSKDDSIEMIRGGVAKNSLIGDKESKTGRIRKIEETTVKEKIAIGTMETIKTGEKKDEWPREEKIIPAAKTDLPLPHKEEDVEEEKMQLVTSEKLPEEQKPVTGAGAKPGRAAGVVTADSAMPAPEEDEIEKLMDLFEKPPVRQQVVVGMSKTFPHGAESVKAGEAPGIAKIPPRDVLVKLVKEGKIHADLPAKPPITPARPIEGAKPVEPRAGPIAATPGKTAGFRRVAEGTRPGAAAGPGERKVVEIKDPGENYRVVDLQTAREGYSYIRILFDTLTNEHLYETIEPELTQDEKTLLEFIEDTLIKTLSRRLEEKDLAEQERQLTEEVDRVIYDHSIRVRGVARQKLIYYIIRDFMGYGKIDVLMKDPNIEDISCDGPGLHIYLFHRQHESIRTNVIFDDDMELDSFVIKLAQKCGKHLSVADPLLDATLPDNSRLQTTLAREVTTRGSSFTIRKFRADPITPPMLVDFGTFSSHISAYFWLAMENGASILYAGGTASGKTTTLNAVSLFIPPQKKIVSIEDTRELNLPHENWIAGVTRSGFAGSERGASGRVAGEIDMYKLLEAALRQRPEYLIVGEVRGKEAFTLFQAMATGHATYSTLHADSVESVVYRLENSPINIPRIMLETLDTVVIQVQVKKGDRMVRRIKELVEIVGIEPRTQELLTNTVFRWDPQTDTFTYYGKSYVMDRIGQLKSMSTEQVKQELDDRTEVLEWMRRMKVSYYKDVAKIINGYYRDPQTVMAMARNNTPIAKSLDNKLNQGGV